MGVQDGGRGTGYLGTGVYFYRTEEGLQHDRSFKSGMPGYKMECPCKRPFVLPNNNDEVWEFHDFSRSLVRNIRYKEEYKPEIDEFSVWPAYLQLMHNGIWTSRKEIVERAKDAIEETKRCLTEHGAVGSFWGGFECDQPINHFLGGYGFDCVMADGEYGDRNDLGCVIFRKPLESCTGEPFDASMQNLRRDNMELVGTRDGKPVWRTKERQLKHLVKGTPEYDDYCRENNCHGATELWVEAKDAIDLDLSMLTERFVKCVGGLDQIECDKHKGTCAKVAKMLEEMK